MEDTIKFKQQDLVLSVNNYYDPTLIDLDVWEPFLDKLCGDRIYQKEAIKNSIIFMVSGRYSCTEDLVRENYKNNYELQKKYQSINDYIKNLQITKKMFANVDLATGTGKSYVIYGIGQIMLGLGFVEKVLVLCPSLTIEAGLKEKFEELSSNVILKNSLPENILYKNPRIINANNTIKNGDICIENIHAIYENTGSSIEDSLENKGEKVLVLNDESHHIFNKNDWKRDKELKKWKEFLIDNKYNFKYVLGFTGTAYIDNNYFNDVIYRYSLRKAIEDGIVKNIEYIQKDDSSSQDEKFQKIYQNHKYNIDKYPKIKPLTVLITKDIEKAKLLRSSLIDFLEKQENVSIDEIEKKVLIVTSDKNHKANIIRLRNVDNNVDEIQWIISVSMLTEGWDVKNVFQIVPWEDRAFNSKLLIAQVLGRGLRIPIEYASPQPKVIIFNHDSWSRNIKGLVNEILEIETRISSMSIIKGKREKYHFECHNLNYSRQEREVEKDKQTQMFDYSRLLKDGIRLDSQVTKVDKGTQFELVSNNIMREQSYAIQYSTWSVEEVVDKIYDEFAIRDWEGKILKLGENQYTQNNLPPRKIIEDIILKSMDNVGIIGERVVEKNAMKILQAFSTLLRKKNKSVIHTVVENDLYKIETKDIRKTSSGVCNLRRDSSVFYTNEWEDEIIDSEQKKVLAEIISDENLPRKALKEVNQFLFKTPLDTVITTLEPERKFVEYLCRKNNASEISCWIKSRDRGFYGIEYSMKYGSENSKTRKYVNKTFNPDFFIKVIRNNKSYILVVETKADKDITEENRAKYNYGIRHFERLNKRLKKNGVDQKYIFHFLSPNSYSEYFEYLRNGILFEEQSRFRCELENLLEDK